MPQLIGLLARKDEAALFGARPRRLPVGVVHLMALPFCHEFGGLVQAPFGLDHVASGDPRLTI
jgi:hypothetical protein